jgi:RNA polymerase sigma factor (sigma-70 family)
MARTETVLLKRFTGSGDAEAFAEIIRRHAGLVYGAALRIVADVDRASDVAQETFLQLTKDAGHVTGSLPGWLHRVATHKAIDLMRRDASRRHREREYTANEPSSPEPVEWKEISPYVDAGLRELAPELRDVLILHFLEGRTTREIALLQGASQATVSRRIGAGVVQLRSKLRRRGILIAVGVLSALLGDNAVQAAPLPLLTELGKMAIVGGGAAGAAGAGAGSGFHTIASSVLAAAKTKAVAVAAVTIISAGSAVTYYEMTRSSSEPVAIVPGGLAAASAVYGAVDSPADTEARSTPPNALPQIQTQKDQAAAVDASLAGSPDEEMRVAQQPTLDPISEDTKSAPGGMMMGGFGMGGFGGMGGMSAQGQEGLQKQQPRPVGGSSPGGPGGGGDRKPPADPNLHDPNDPAKP